MKYVTVPFWLKVSATSRASHRRLNSGILSFRQAWEGGAGGEPDVSVSDRGNPIGLGKVWGGRARSGGSQGRGFRHRAWFGENRARFNKAGGVSSAHASHTSVHTCTERISLREYWSCVKLSQRWRSR